MILYLSVLAFLINSSNISSCNFLQIDMLYQIPPVIQYELFLYISYYRCLFVSVIHDIPTWCNTVFNTNEVIISLYLVFILSTDKPVCFPQLLHLISIFSTLFHHFVPYYTINESETLKKSLTMTAIVLSRSLSFLTYTPLYSKMITN